MVMAQDRSVIQSEIDRILAETKVVELRELALEGGSCQLAFWVTRRPHA